MAGLIQKEMIDGNYHMAALEDPGGGWEGVRKDGVVAIDMFKGQLWSLQKWRICYPNSKEVGRGVSVGFGYAGDGRRRGLSRHITPASTLQLTRAVFNLICAAWRG